jgi:hypothetical protein
LSSSLAARSRHCRAPGGRTCVDLRHRSAHQGEGKTSAAQHTLPCLEPCALNPEHTLKVLLSPARPRRRSPSPLDLAVRAPALAPRVPAEALYVELVGAHSRCPGRWPAPIARASPGCRPDAQPRAGCPLRLPSRRLRSGCRRRLLPGKPSLCKRTPERGDACGLARGTLPKERLAPWISELKLREGLGRWVDRLGRSCQNRAALQAAPLCTGIGGSSRG